MPRTSAYWAPRGGVVVDPDDAAASVNEIQAALLQPGGGVIQQRRTRIVDAGRTYRLGVERDLSHAKASATTRLERMKQVREQEKLWARFQAKEFRASVKEHHAELEHQLREGWLKAKEEKQRELENDYSNAVQGVGRAQRDAAERGHARRGRKQDAEVQRFDDELNALERFETALGKEFARLDELDRPHFDAAGRRVVVEKLADQTRADMRERLLKFDASEAGQRRRLVERLVAETDARVARPLLRPDAFRDTHFNDLVVNAAGVGVGVSRAPNGGSNASPIAFNTPAAGATDEPRDVAPIRGEKHAVSAFERAFEEEKALAERRDADLRARQKLRNKEAKRASAAAVKARALASAHEMEKKLADENRRERAERIATLREGGGLVHAPLLKTWKKRRETRENLRDFERAFTDISRAAGREPASEAKRETEPERSPPRGRSGPADAFDDGEPFDGMFEPAAEEARFGRLERVLAMAQTAVPADDLQLGPGPASPAGAGVAAAASPNRPRVEGAAERLAKHGVVGATMEEIAAVVAAGDAAVVSPAAARLGRLGPSVALSETDDDDDDDDDDFVGSAGGAGFPAGEYLPSDDAELDAALAAAAAHHTPERFGVVLPPAEASLDVGEYTLGGAAAVADESTLADASRSMNLSDDTSHLFSASMDAADVDPDAGGNGGFGSPADAGSAPADAGSAPAASSSSGSAEAEMRASLAATNAAMDRVSAAAAAAERTLDDAARRAAASPTRPSGAGYDRDAPSSPLPARVPLPELRPLDAILGALGEQVDALDAAAAIAARAATEGTSSSSGLSVDGTATTTRTGAPSETTEAMYAAAAAAAAAANNSAPPSSTTFGDVSTLGDGAATPGAALDADATRSDASPRDDAGAPALTPASERDTPYDVRPQRDVAGALRGFEFGSGFGFDRRGASSPAAISAVAAKIAAAAVADAAPGESPEATARRVAAGMAAALDPKRAPGSPALWDGGDDNPDSSWARALGALDDEWAASVRLAETDAVANASEAGRFVSPARRFASPSRYAGVASADDDEDFAAAEAEARGLAAAEAEGTAPVAGASADDDATTRAASFAPPMRVFAEDDAASLGTASLAFDASLSLDGRSLAALANALDARSFDARSDSEAEDDDAFGVGSETRDASRHAPAVAPAPVPAGKRTKKRGATRVPARGTGGSAAAPRVGAATKAKAPRAPRSMGSLLGKPSVAFVPAEPAEEGPNDAEAEAAARRKAEAAALRKKAAAFDRKNRANLRDAATKKR